MEQGELLMSLLDAYFIHTGSLKNPTSLNAGGERTLGSATTIRGRLEPSSKLFRDTKTGEIIQYDGTWFCNSNIVLYNGSEITVNSVVYEVIGIEILNEFTARHKEVYLKRV